MEQNFKLVAPRARLAQQYGSKIGEMLFGSMIFPNSGRYLVDLLAVPVVRKCDGKQTPVEPQDTLQNDCSHAQDECSEVTPTGAIKRKAHAEMSKSHPRLGKKTDRGGQAQDSQPATLSGLPIEILLLITYHIEFIEDVVSLGLANKRLCGIAQEELRLYFARYFAPWANQKIACVGEHSEANDFPPGLFSDAELEALGQEEIEAYVEQIEEWIMLTPCSLDDFTYPGISKMQQELDFYLLPEASRLRHYFSEHRRLDDAAMNSLLPLWEVGRESFPTDQPWILRNLTTKQFVRAEAIALKPEFIKGPHIDVLGFGEVVLSRICWSSVAASDMKDPTTICRGIWAGHRFDITTLTRHERKTSGDGGWTDASDEIAKEIATIWGDNLGADWREKLCKRNKWTRHM